MKKLIYPIRGKLINAFSCSREKFFNNEEVQGITRIILGTDYRKNFDVSECKVDKVVFLSDADVDGAHICALLERMFIMYFPQMISAGMVYKATPPLYSVRVGGKDKFFTDNFDMIKYNQRLFSQKYSLKNSKKVQLTAKELTLFFVRNTEYNYYLNSIANTYALERPLFEDILTSYVECGNKVDLAKLQKVIKSKYRFMDVVKEKSGIVVVKGVITKSNVAILSDKFFVDCAPLLNIMKSNDYLHYYIDSTPASIYNVMSLYEKTQPNGVHRYKGLGETSESILENSVMSPLGDRTLIQYTMEDFKDTLSTIREYESDKKKILSLVGNITRDDLIE